MNTNTFIKTLQYPEQISEEKTLALAHIIDEFPYFQSSRAVYLKGLKNKGSFKYNQELKTTAAYTTNRSILFHFITSDIFFQNEISNHLKTNTEHIKKLSVYDAKDISVNKSVVIDATLKSQIDETKPVLDPHLFENKTETENFELKRLTKEKLSLGKPLEFNKAETHSFIEWLKVTNPQPIKRADDTTTYPSDPKQNKKQELIDKFIERNPKIQPIKKDSTSATETVKHNLHEPESIMTETLARVYIEQKNYDKAIKAYEILSLKYPEKSGFFADQIRAIKELQN